MAESLYRLILFLPIFVLAVVIHECAHAWMADRRGDPTGREMGRLTLDPRPHLDPWGSLMFLISSLMGFGFGWAKPVPVDPRNLKNPRRDMMWIALAGPGSNFLQALAWLGLFYLAVRLAPVNWWNVGLGSTLGELLLYGVVINIFLLFFNLVPLPPLDGGRILVGLLPAQPAAAVARLEPFGFLLFLIIIGTPLYRILILGPANWLIRLLLRLLGG
ncbi:MAG TPA: site-2 protease family protein [Armatimonadetes bacterium]|nr:site-2 protease family protein [Armatimonadota bacterium]